MMEWLNQGRTQKVKDATFKTESMITMKDKDGYYKINKEKSPRDETLVEASINHAAH